LLDSTQTFFGVELQNGIQIFYNRIPQMAKYFVMRECENIPTRISLCCDLAFAHKKEFPIFKFLDRFLEISFRDITILTLLTTLII
jgi:hypothetical protein